MPRIRKIHIGDTWLATLDGEQNYTYKLTVVAYCYGYDEYRLWLCVKSDIYPERDCKFEYEAAQAYWFDAYGVSTSRPRFRFIRKSRAKTWTDNDGRVLLRDVVQINE